MIDLKSQFDQEDSILERRQKK